MAWEGLELEFLDGTFLFNLKLPQLKELQKACECSAFELNARLTKGRYFIGEIQFGKPIEGVARIEDLYEVIRLGLVGGGLGRRYGEAITVDPIIARDLATEFCENTALIEVWDAAYAIVLSRFEGFTPPVPDKKKEPATRKPRSTSRKSSRTAQPSEPTGAI